MSLADKNFVERVAKEVALKGRARVRPIISRGIAPGFGSKALAREVEIRPGVRTARSATQRIFIDSYTAFYVHEGRGPFGPPRNARIFVWYKNPKEDPRLRSNPKRFSSLRKLTSAEFYRDKAAGKLVITRFVHKGVPGSPFFSNDPGGGMAGFLTTTAQPLLKTRTEAHIRIRLKSILNIKKSLKLT